MLGPNTSVINGQRVPFFPDRSITPVAYVPVAPQGVAQTYPTLPGIVGNPVGNDAGNASQAVNDPFSIRQSPLPWAIGFLVVGLLGLRLVHWRFLGKEL